MNFGQAGTVEATLIIVELDSDIMGILVDHQEVVKDTAALDIPEEEDRHLEVCELQPGHHLEVILSEAIGLQDHRHHVVDGVDVDALIETVDVHVDRVDLLDP